MTLRACLMRWPRGFIFLACLIAPLAANGTSDNLRDDMGPEIGDDVIVDNFNRWLGESSPPGFPMMEVRVAEGMRFGTYATKPIREGQLYSLTPWRLLMGEHTMKTSDRSRYLSLDLHSALLLFLMHEKRKGDQSFWSPYIDLLPRFYDTPVHWPENQLSFLQGTSVLAAVKGEKVRDRGTYARLRDYLQQNDPDLVDYFTFPRYRWAASVLDSRTIHIGGKINLVPMLDMINCRHDLKDHSKIHSTVFSQERDAAVTKALWSFKVGDQVWESYGQPNHIYYKFHSFMIDNNVHDCVNYDLPSDVLDSANDYIRHHNLRVRIRESSCISATQLPQDLVISFSIARQRHLMGGRTPTQTATELPSKLGHWLLFDKLLDRIAEFPSEEEDEARLEADKKYSEHQLPGPELGYTLNLAIRYRMNERRIFQEVLELCRRSRIAEWDASEL